jgi:hypothetical protein
MGGRCKVRKDFSRAVPIGRKDPFFGQQSDFRINHLGLKKFRVWIWQDYNLKGGTVINEKRNKKENKNNKKRSKRRKNY